MKSHFFLKPTVEKQVMKNDVDVVFGVLTVIGFVLGKMELIRR